MRTRSMTGRRVKPIRVLQTAGVVVLLIAAYLGATASQAMAALTVTVINTDGQGVASRYAPQIAATNGYGAPANATVTANCWTWGDSVGPYANRLWWSITYAGRTFYAADRYLSTPNVANQPPAGQPQCGTPAPPPPPPPPPPAPGGSVSTPVWIGAPYAGYWPGSPLPNTSRPGTHAPVFGGDWAMDYYQVAGTKVYVYAAPKDAALNAGITTSVTNVTATCGSGNISFGGYNVTVSVYDRGVKVGWVSYGHVNPDFNNDGVTNATDVNFRGGISRWGGLIGRIGQYTSSTSNTCWQVSNPSGHHVHFEAYNQKNFSCFRSVSNHAAIQSNEYMGYLGGSFGGGSCPAGA